MNIDNFSNKYKIDDKYYDLSEFVKIHPGGQDIFNHLKNNTNITPMVYLYHKNPKKILEILPKYEIQLPDNVEISYENSFTYDKYCELKSLVNDEMQENKIPYFWGNREIMYNFLLLSLYIGLWTYSFYNVNNLSILYAFGLALYTIGFVGLSFHETAHYTGFKNQKINKFISNYIAFIYFTTNEWKERHNYLHHCFTNTEYDDDFHKNKFLLRHSNNHKHYIHHKFQYLYLNILFILNGFNIKIKKGAPIEDYIQLLCILFLWYWFGFLHFFILLGTVGFSYTLIANLSHIQHECIQVNNDKKKDFLYNQVSSSINYKTNNPLIRFITLGLDIQTEHHLFPNIPHSSLRKIQHIVRKYCEKNDIPYIEKPNIYSAIKSYLTYMFKIGNP